MKARIIKTEHDYNEAVDRLSVLMNAATGPEEEAELELLALLIEDYERKTVPDVQISPIDAILFRMDQMGLRKKDLVPYMGSLSKISEVLSGKRPLSLNMIRQLNKGLGISADVLIAQSDFTENIIQNTPNEDYARYPISELKERGYFDKFDKLSLLPTKVSQWYEYSEDLMSYFFGNLKVRGKSPAFLRAPQHQNGIRSINDYALIAWLGCVLKKARACNLSVTYQAGIITNEWLCELARLSRFEQGPLLAQQFLAQHGIALVVEQHFQKTYLDGAALMDDQMPIIGLTLRHDRLDNFWFVLLHELIHVQKHLSTELSYITDELDNKIQASKAIEEEANQGANDALIPPKQWNEIAKVILCDPTPENIKQWANDLKIHEAIVAGRVRYETGNWRLLSGMIGRGQVYQLFASQTRQL